MDALKSYLIKLILDQLMGFLISKLPLLASGPLNWIASFFLKKIITWIVENTAVEIMVLWIKGERKVDVERFKESVQKLHNLTGEETEEELDEIDKDISDAARNLIKHRRV